MKKSLSVLVLAATVLMIAAPGGVAVADDEEYRIARNKLETTEIPTIAFQDEDIETVIEFCQSITGLNFVVTPEVLDEEIRVNLNLTNVSVKTVLKLIVRLNDLRIYYLDGVIIVDLKGEWKEDPYMRMYDIRALQVKIRDFPGPEISLECGDEDIGAVVFDAGDDGDDEITTETIVDMIQEFTGAGTWEEDERCSVTTFGGMLIVVQHSDTHREILWLLAMLESFR